QALWQSRARAVLRCSLWLLAKAETGDDAEERFLASQLLDCGVQLFGRHLVYLVGFRNPLCTAFFSCHLVLQPLARSPRPARQARVAAVARSAIAAARSLPAQAVSRRRTSAVCGRSHPTLEPGQLAIAQRPAT